MGIDRRVAGGAGEVLVLAVQDVMTRVRIAELLGQPEVDQEELIAVPTNAHEEVVRLNVAMDEALQMDVLQATDHLVDQHQHCLDGEVARAEVEQVLERGSQQVHDQGVEVLLLAVVTDTGEAHAAAQDAVQLGLVQQLRMTGVGTLHLDGHLLAALDAHAQVNVAKRAASCGFFIVLARGFPVVYPIPIVYSPIFLITRYLPPTIISGRLSFNIRILSILASCSST